jgi:hypothetical protein
MAVQLAIAIALLALLAAYQVVMIGHTLYYFEKILHMATVVALVAVGGAARLLPAPRPGRWARRVAPGMAVVVVVAAFMAGLGGRVHLTPLGGAGVRYALALDKGSPLGGRDAIRIARRYPDGDKVNVDLMHTPFANFYGTLFSAVLVRNYRYGADWYYRMYPPGRPMTPADLERMVVDSTVPVRFFVQYPKASFLVLDPDHPNRPRPGPGVDPAAFGDPAAPDNITAVEALARKYPDKVEVVHAPPEWAK